MKLGIHYIYWQTDLKCQSYVPYVEKAKRLGFDVLELGDYLILNMPESEVEDLAVASREYGIELSVGLDPPQDSALTSGCEGTRNRGVAWYHSVFPRLQKMGITALGGNMLNAAPELPLVKYYKREWANGVDSIYKIGKCAADYGINISVEICNRFESHLLNTAAQGVAFVKEVDLPNVKILLDTFHMNIEEDSFEDAFRLSKGSLGHVHLGEGNRKLPGNGHLPWESIFNALKEIGYNDIMAMEPLVGFGGELGDCCKIWRNMTNGANERQMDQAAARAAKFVREFIG